MPKPPPRKPGHRTPTRPRPEAPEVVALDESLDGFAGHLRARLGSLIVIDDVSLRDATVWVTSDADMPALGRVRHAHPTLTIIVIANLDRGGRHDHARLVDAVNAGAAAYLIDPTPSLLAVHVRHARCRGRRRGHRDPS